MWPCQVKEGNIISDQSLLTAWLTVGLVNLVSNYSRASQVEPWNEVETLWSDAQEMKVTCMSSNRRVRLERTKVLGVSVQEG